MMHSSNKFARSKVEKSTKALCTIHLDTKHYFTYNKRTVKVGGRAHQCERRPLSCHLLLMPEAGRNARAAPRCERQLLPSPSRMRRTRCATRIRRASRRRRHLREAHRAANDSTPHWRAAAAAAGFLQKHQRIPKSSRT